MHLSFLLLLLDYFARFDLFFSFFAVFSSFFNGPMAFNLSSTSFYSSKVKAAILERNIQSKIDRQRIYNVHLKDIATKSALRKRFLLPTPSSPRSLIEKTSRREVVRSYASSDTEQNTSEDKSYHFKNEVGPDRVSWLVWAIHDCAAKFSLSIRNLELARVRTEVSMAWIGVDAHAWHKRMAYQVAIYGLLDAVIRSEQFLSQNRSDHPFPVRKALSPNTSFLKERIESQLRSENPGLVRWFQVVQLPRLLKLFIPMFRKWSLEYAESGVAGTVMALACCASVIKLGPGRLACPSFSHSIEESFVELMNDAQIQVSIDEFHRLAAEAGFEDDFLRHFGSKIIPCKNVEDMEFWIGLVLKKLCAAFERESVAESSNKINGNCLAVLGLFAYLGRESRLFVSKHSIRDMDEQIKHFLSNLECGVVFVYPEFSTISLYQLFMEVIVDEIGWLDFFASSNFPTCQERKRPKNHDDFFITCYDVMSGFTHYSSSAQQKGLYSDLSEFLLHSQNLLWWCLEDYLAAYDETGELARIGERNALSCAEMADDLRSREKCRQNVNSSEEQIEIPGSDSKELKKFTWHNFVKSSMQKIVSASTDIWIGTQLLFADISTAVKLSAKTLWGHRMTNRERKKIVRTIADMATLVPVTILMLIPVSAVGHAAIFAAIKRYVPFLIPSSYTDERIDSVKQLRMATMALKQC